MKLLQYSTVVKAIAISVALAFSSITFAAEAKCSKGADKKAQAVKEAPTTVKKEEPSYLFVVQAEQGMIETIDGQTKLVLKHTDVHHVIKFSDRPYRSVKYITGEDLKNLWKEDKDSFADDPPNAVLSSAGQKAQIVILNGMTVTKTTVEFPISISDDEAKVIGNIKEGTISDVILVIDNYPHNEWSDAMTACCNWHDCFNNQKDDYKIRRSITAWGMDSDYCKGIGWL